MSDRLCVVMPVYNERDAIGGVLRKWSAALDALQIDYTIRPYNDGSKDDSLAVMREVSMTLPHVEVRDKPNGGHGPTILQGYREAAADGFDWVFQIDSDDEMGPDSFAELWGRRDDCDFLVGRRAGRKQALPRKIVSFVSRIAVRLFYGKSSVWDVNAPYRLMRVSAFRETFSRIPPTTFAPNVILTGMAAWLGLRVFEMPVPQHDRTTGEVSIKKWKLLKAAARSLLQLVAFSDFTVPAALSLVLAATDVLLLDRMTFIWYDELCMCDGVFMKALHGLSWSGVWACSYNPLYPISLVAWVKLWGASHLAVCSFTVAVGFVTSLVLMDIARRRGWFSSRLANSIFVLGFWSCSLFGWMLTNARVDVLVLLLTALYADALARSAEEGIGLWRTFFWAAVLFLAAPYTLPLLAFFGLFLLVVADGWSARKMVLKRGFVSAAGFSVGFLIVAGYYFAQHDLIRLLGSYVYFNSITGFRPEPFSLRVFHGYGYDIQALVLFVLSLPVLLWRGGRAWCWVGFVALIPLLMVLGGRYEIYYAWVFFIPSLLLFVSAASRCGKSVLLVLLAVGAFGFPWRTLERVRAADKARPDYDRYGAFVERNAARFAADSDVVVAADLGQDVGFYYPLVACGVRIWYRGPEMMNGRTDEEKFGEGLSFLAKTESQRKQLKEFVSRVQRFMPLLPDSGWVLFGSREKYDALASAYERAGHPLAIVDEHDGFVLCQMSSKPVDAL